MKHLKLIKEDTVENFITSDKAGIPCVCCYNENHENYDANEPVIIITERPAPTSKPILSFTIEVGFPILPGYTEGHSCTFQFEEGMTWNEWCNSKYNTLGYYIGTSDERDFVVHEFGDYVFYSGVSVRSTDIIMNTTYTYYI